MIKCFNDFQYILGGSIGIANINDFQQKPSILRANGSKSFTHDLHLP